MTLGDTVGYPPFTAHLVVIPLPGWLQTCPDYRYVCSSVDVRHCSLPLTLAVVTLPVALQLVVCRRSMRLLRFALKLYIVVYDGVVTDLRRCAAPVAYVLTWMLLRLCSLYVMFTGC